MPLPNYYQILQVDPGAEPEVIEAAYRRLLRKYHPDVLTPEERNDPDVHRKVQEINEAYEVLKNPQSRTYYDTQIRRESAEKPKLQSPTIDVEQRLYLVRCGKTHQTFQMMIGRKKGTNNPYRVLGFEPLLQNDSRSNQMFDGESLFIKRLQDMLFGLFGRHKTREVIFPENARMVGFPSEKAVRDLFGKSSVLNLGDINWENAACPDCGSVRVHANGKYSTWVRCGLCAHIFCAGGIKVFLGQEFIRCPWCGNRNIVAKQISAGSKWHSPIQGGINDPRNDMPGDPALNNAKAKKQLTGNK